MHLISHCLSAFRWVMLNNPELVGVCPNMSYPSVEILFLKRELTFTFSKINCPIDSRVPAHTMHLATLSAS